MRPKSRGFPLFWRENLSIFPFHTLFSIVKIDEEKYTLCGQYEEYKKITIKSHTLKQTISQC